RVCVQCVVNVRLCRPGRLTTLITQNDSFHQELTMTYSLRMPFGRYKGQRLCDLPKTYLEYILGHLDKLHGDLLIEICDELRYRRVDWLGVIHEWHERMVLKHHPDRGGSKEVMQQLDAAAEELKELVSERMQKA